MSEALHFNSTIISVSEQTSTTPDLNIDFHHTASRVGVDPTNPDVIEVYQNFVERFADAQVTAYLPAILHKTFMDLKIAEGVEDVNNTIQSPDKLTNREIEQAQRGLNIPALLSSLWSRLT